MCAPARNQQFPPGVDRGQVTPLVAVVMAMVAVLIVGLVAVGDVLADRAVARTAADAAALAAASGTDADAASIARDNGAALLSVHRLGAEVEVEVRVGRATARARAAATRVLDPGHGAHRKPGGFP